MKLLVNNLDEELRCDFPVSVKIKKVWNVELNTLEAVKTICKKHSITYYAIAGTLLGAIRHNGFIPWDDDMDIGMPRKDYVRFLKVVDRELPNELFAQTYFNTRSFPYDMIKIRNSNTTGFTPWEKNENCNKGIFIDIFPIDNMPDDLEIRKRESEDIKALLYKATLLSRKTDSSAPFRIIKSLVKKALISTGNKYKENVIERAINLCSNYNNIETVFCGMRSFSNPEKFTWRNDACNKFVEMPFENTSIVVPVGYDSILTSIYGDYNVFVKADSFHEGATFDPDTPYKLFHD